MILALLTRFSDSEDAIVGFTLCQKLAEHGYPLYVTTTSTGEALQQEKDKADEICTRTKGSVTLLQPECKEDENPTAEWVVTHHEEYFSFLSELNDIQAVIGILPGTEKSAVEVKEALNCKLVLLAPKEIPDVYQQRLTDLKKAADTADEIWVFGSEVHHFYCDLFPNLDATPCEKLKELSLQPFIERFIKKRNSSRNDNTCDFKNITSLWKKSYESFVFREEVLANGSDPDSFLTLCSALEQLNLETMSKQIQWQIYG